MLIPWTVDCVSDETSVSNIAPRINYWRFPKQSFNGIGEGMFRRLTQFYRNVITSMTAFVIWL